MEEILLSILEEFRDLNLRVSGIESQLQEIMGTGLYNSISDIYDKLDQVKDDIDNIKDQVSDGLTGVCYNLEEVKYQINDIKGPIGYDLTDIYDVLSNIGS